MQPNTAPTTLVAQDPRMVELHFELRLPEGDCIDSTRERAPARFRLGDGNLPEAFEQCLLGMAVGERRVFTLAPEQAFGQPNPANVQHMPRSRFVKDTLAKGLVVSFEGPGGHLPGVIQAWDDQRVTVDFNHPLAGRTLHFDVEILRLLEEVA